jgi:hypothetical protein
LMTPKGNGPWKSPLLSMIITLMTH